MLLEEKHCFGLYEIICMIGQNDFCVEECTIKDMINRHQISNIFIKVHVLTLTMLHHIPGIFCNILH